MSKNLLLVPLAIIVLLVTYLNHYTTQRSVAYFTNAAAQDQRELVRANAVSNAQALANRAFMLAQIEAARSVRLEKDRDEAVDIGMDLLVERNALTQLCDEQNDYIVLLEKTLQKYKLPLPKPTPAKPLVPVPNSGIRPQPAPPAERTTILQMPLSSHAA
jgi:hypothetical protein